MKKYLTVTVLVTGLLLPAVMAYAQPRMPEEGGRLERREKIRERIETLKMWKLIEVLELDKESSMEIFPIINEYDSRREALMKEVMETGQKLKKNFDTYSDKEIKGAVEALRKSKRQMFELDDEEFDALGKVLTPRQQAKYIVFKQEFQKRLQKLISQARGGKKPGGKYARRGGQRGHKADGPQPAPEPAR